VSAVPSTGLLSTGLLTTGLLRDLLVHLGLAALALALACLLALPAAVVRGHRHHGAGDRPRPGVVPVVALAAVLLLLPPPWGGGAPAVVVAVGVLCAPPLFSAAVAGLSVVEPAAVEALRAAGASERQVVRDVELVLAGPAVAAGVRRAASQALGGVALAGLLGGPGLGAGIARGVAAGDPARYLPAAAALALLGLLAAGLLALVQRAADPLRRGERARPRRTPVPLP